MRNAVISFAEDVAENLPIAEPLVELGARAADGQEGLADLRTIFGAGTHIGCDIQAGPGVDRIEDVHHLSFDDASVGTVVCLETLEHVHDPIRAVQEMHRVLRPGGVLAISSLMFFPIHAHPWDFWRFTPEGFRRLLEPFESRLVAAQGWELLPEGVFGVGVKGPADLEAEVHLPRTTRIAEAWGRQPVDLGPMRMTTRDTWALAAGATVDAISRRLRRHRPSRGPGRSAG